MIENFKDYKERYSLVIDIRDSTEKTMELKKDKLKTYYKSLFH